MPQRTIRALGGWIEVIGGVAVILGMFAGGRWLYLYEYDTTPPISNLSMTQSGAVTPGEPAMYKIRWKTNGERRKQCGRPIAARTFVSRPDGAPQLLACLDPFGVAEVATPDDEGWYNATVWCSAPRNLQPGEYRIYRQVDYICNYTRRILTVQSETGSIQVTP
jgi:hypothetical protein